MDKLIKNVSLISVNFLNLNRLFIVDYVFECIRSSVDLLIRYYWQEVSLLLYFKERRRRPIMTISGKHVCKTKQMILAAL